MKKKLIVLLLTGWVISVNAQQSFNPLQAVTNPYTDQSILAFLDAQKDSAVEDFDLSRNVYSFKFGNSGFLLEFNFNFILSSIWLHDSGYAFKSYKGKLPFELKWGMKQETLMEKKHGFAPDSLNPYMMHRNFEKGFVSAYFYGNKLQSLYIVARPDLLSLSDELFVQNWGYRLYPNGKKIEGDCLDGTGVMTWGTNEGTYQGNWKWGIPHGKGLYIDETGTTFEGVFKLGFAWGKVKVVYPETAVYEGNLIYSRKSGQGKIVYKTGMIYEGTWHFDTMQGQGTYYLNSNYSYTGAFENNQFNGKGKLFTPEGYFEGSFKNGKPHGQGEQFASRTHAILRGTWVNGSKEGSFYYHDPLTGSRMTMFKNDQEMIKVEK